MKNNVVTPDDFYKLRNERPISDEVINKYVEKLNQGILDVASVTFEKWAEVIVDKSFLELSYDDCMAIAQRFIDAGWYAVYCTYGNSDKIVTAKWVFLTWDQEDNWIAEKRDNGTYVNYTLVGSKGEE